ncbi:hypothetical protein QYF36_014174 [Acer negundo]|nr:hypothetical protein QYF36_014174 [Acer negundo]
MRSLSKGRCSRQTCSFAHGDSELRQSFGSYNEIFIREKEMQSEHAIYKPGDSWIASKIKKFVKAHNCFLRIQDDLKRQLGYQLGSYAFGATGNVENLSVNIVSDRETTNYHLLGPQTEMQTISFPNKKKLHARPDSADITILEGTILEANVARDVEAANNGVPKGGKNISAGFSSADKSKVLGLRSLLPSTGIAAHVIEQEIEIEVEMFEEVEMDSSRVKKGAINAAPRNEDAI